MGATTYFTILWFMTLTVQISTKKNSPTVYRKLIRTVFFPRLYPPQHLTGNSNGKEERTNPIYTPHTCVNSLYLLLNLSAYNSIANSLKANNSLLRASYEIINTVFNNFCITVNSINKAPNTNCFPNYICFSFNLSTGHHRVKEVNLWLTTEWYIIITNTSISYISASICFLIHSYYNYYP